MSNCTTNGKERKKTGQETTAIKSVIKCKPWDYALTFPDRNVSGGSHFLAFNFTLKISEMIL